jgi:hypothetical protein
LCSIFVPETVPTPITRPFSSLLTTALLGAKRCPENPPAFLLSLSFDHHFANIVEPVFAPNINASLHLLPKKTMATTTPVSLMKVMPYKGVGCLEKRFQWIVLREKGRKQCRELDAVEVRR